MPLIDDSALARRYLAPLRFLALAMGRRRGGHRVDRRPDHRFSCRVGRASSPGLRPTDCLRSVRWCSCWPHVATAGRGSQAG